jgi:CRISPR/Cas system CSM-associated protein Csm5 (group 7 of RAMP superfamily)
MNSILNENMSCIKNYQFIHYKIFILCHEENENLSKLAIEEHKATDMVNRAIREYVHQFKSKFNEILNYLLEFYKKEIGKVNEEWEKIEENEENDEKNEEIEKGRRRWPYVQIQAAISPLIHL